MTDNVELKEQFLDYYKDMPIKKYAAASIAKDENTTRRWEKDDADFEDRIMKAKANYLLKKAKNLRPEFIIPLLFRELTPRQEITGKDGKPIPILGSVKVDTKAESTS